MFGTILTWVFSGGLAKLGDIGLNFYKAKLGAEDTVERQTVILAQKAFELQAKEAEFDNKLLVAEQGNWMTRWVRPMWTLPFIIFCAKVVVWDKVLKLGTTDPLDPNMWTLMQVIAASYFGGRSLETIARIWQARQGLTGSK
jgi:hypothetical protein